MKRYAATLMLIVSLLLPAFAQAQQLMICKVEKHNVDSDFANKPKVKCLGHGSEMKSLKQLMEEGWGVMHITPEAMTNDMTIRIILIK